MISWRVNLILFLIFALGAVIIGRLFFIQVLQGDFYRAMAQGMYSLEEEIPGQRGEIFFKNGEPLAINIEWPLVFASPREVELKDETAEKLAEIINIDKETILEDLEKDSLYAVIKKEIKEEEINRIREADLEGIYLGKEAGRYYPQEDFASQLTGFLDADKKGQYGLEGYYDEILQASKKEGGNDLFLTVDYSIQFVSEELLKRAEESLKIEGGEIIVMDPTSGKILAMANFPNFNPNNYKEYANEEQSDVFQNSATQKIFEPGSVFKPITMAIAMNEGKITPQSTYYDPGEIRIGGYKILNYEERIYPGEITMTGILEKSINTGAVYAKDQVGNIVFAENIEKFGIFEPTKIDVQETCPENKEFKKGYEIGFATASFGQGIEMTPIQLLRAYSVLVNGGKIVQPYIVEKIRTNGAESEINPEVIGDPIISPKTSSQIIAMLVSVVENGFAKSAQIPGYYVAGKTGTAQVAWSALGVSKAGYSDKTVQTFVGFAPAFNPQFLIVIKLNNPQTKTAEYSAIPLFHDLAKYIIDYYQIPPDYQE